MSIAKFGSSSSEGACRRELSEVKLRLMRAEAQLDAHGRQADELNHRIANSLALASSFLILQQKRLEDQDAKQALEMASARITAIAKIHRHLAGRGQTSQVDFGQFLKELGPEIASSTGLRCDIDAEPVEVSGEAATKLAVAVNELVINAAKHAYAAGEEGQVRIVCGREPGSRLRLTVADGGFGLPDDFDIDAAKGLGMAIVRDTVRQLGGAIDFENNQGARFVMVVPSAGLQPSNRSYSDSGTP